jgi:broad specificity phosphatase PhoE
VTSASGRTSAVELLLVRHGLPRSDAPDDEALDPGLGAEGERQAHLVAETLAGGAYGRVTAIATSPMRRARETAEPLAARLGLVVAPDPRLAELDDGATRYGLGFEHFPTRAALFVALNSGHWGDYHFDPQAFAARAVAGIEAAATAHSHGVVAIFCHGGVISAYVAHLAGGKRPFFLASMYTGISRVTAHADGYRELASFNETYHLRQR